MSYVQKELFFPSSDGKNTLHAEIYEPRDTEIRAVVQISHGMVDFIGRYKILAEALCAAGFVLAGNDHLGHGTSVANDADFGYFAKSGGYSILIDDLYGMNRILTETYPDTPIILLGHSMGSFLARLYASRYADSIDGLIIHGTAGKNPAAPFGKILVNLMMLFKGERYRSEFVKSLAEGGYNKAFDESEGIGAWLTRDGTLVADRPNDKRTNFTFTLSGYRDLFEMLQRCNSRDWFASYPAELPTLVISGGDDPVGNFGIGVKEVHEKLLMCGAVAELKLYDGARHELFNETNREEVFSDLIAFLEECIEE